MEGRGWLCIQCISLTFDLEFMLIYFVVFCIRILIGNCLHGFFVVDLVSTHANEVSPNPRSGNKIQDKARRCIPPLTLIYTNESQKNIN